MTTAWALNTVGVFSTTVGALLIYLYLWRSPRTADDIQSPEGKLAYADRRRKLLIGVGLLALWLVVQSAAIVLI